MSATRTYPFPIPFGWFSVGYSEDFAAGTAVPRFYFGRHLVVWRDHSGEAHVQDAFCPHLGAHLGHGGTVEDCQIVCPFHGWAFNGEGANVNIPYSERINRKAHLRTYPVHEANGMVFTWYHPEEAAPMWDVPLVPEFEESTDYSTVFRTSHEIDACWQEMAENGVDTAHFRFVHNTGAVPQLEEYSTGFPGSVMRSAQKFPTPRGVMEGRIDATATGPGLSVVWFTGIIDTVNLATNTPIDENRCHLRFNFRFKTMGDEKTTANVGRAFVDEVDKQVREDRPIWEHKAHLVRPALADNDGPFMKFRKWAAQFYAEPVDHGDQLVYEPTYWPDRLDDAPAKATASARNTR